MDASAQDTGLEWHRWQSVKGNATVVWHTPQDFPWDMSTIEYRTMPRFTPMNISG
jgi:hypothetical protein